MERVHSGENFSAREKGNFFRGVDFTVITGTAELCEFNTSAMPGFLARESESFIGILQMIQLNPVPVFGKYTSSIRSSFFHRKFSMKVSALRYE